MYYLFAALILVSYGVVTFIPFVLIESQGALGIMPRMPPHGQHPIPPRNNFIAFIMGYQFIKFMLVLVFACTLKFYNRLKKTEAEKVSAELSYLKAQINPHFLFNTLNSIYSSAIEERAKNTASAVVKLAGMMRYVISETDADFVSLDKEINYVSDYVDLQKVRLENTVAINYTVNGIAAGKRIAPLILIPFIENTFKHGVNAEEDSAIKINIEIADDKLTMTVANNKVKTTLDENEKSGLGIENARQRLQLIYPAKHILEITEDKKEFKVFLILSLS